MKLATRISSIRRSAWKQCRSCSADSDSMWPRLVGQVARSPGGCARPRASSTRGDGILREPVDLAGRVRARAARGRSRRRAGRGRARSARRRRAPAAARPGGARSGRARAAVRPRRVVDEVAQREVDLDRLARVRGVAAVVDRHQLAAGRRRPAPWRRAYGVDLVVGRREITSTGQRTRARSASCIASRRRAQRRPRSALAISVSASVSSAHPIASSICFVECGVLNIRRTNHSTKSP